MGCANAQLTFRPGSAATTERGPPRTDVDSRLTGKLRFARATHWGVQRGKAPLRFSHSPKSGGMGVEKRLLSQPPKALPVQPSATEFAGTILTNLLN